MPSRRRFIKSVREVRPQQDYERREDAAVVKEVTAEYFAVEVGAHDDQPRKEAAHHFSEAEILLVKEEQPLPVEQRRQTDFKQERESTGEEAKQQLKSLQHYNEGGKPIPCWKLSGLLEETRKTIERPLKEEEAASDNNTPVLAEVQESRHPLPAGGGEQNRLQKKRRIFDEQLSKLTAIKERDSLLGWARGEVSDTLTGQESDTVSVTEGRTDVSRRDQTYSVRRKKRDKRAAGEGKQEEEGPEKEPEAGGKEKGCMAEWVLRVAVGLLLATITSIGIYVIHRRQRGDDDDEGSENVHKKNRTNSYPVLRNSGSWAVASSSTPTTGPACQNVSSDLLPDFKTVRSVSTVSPEETKSDWLAERSGSEKKIAIFQDRRLRFPKPHSRSTQAWLREVQDLQHVFRPLP